MMKLPKEWDSQRRELMVSCLRELRNLLCLNLLRPIFLYMCRIGLNIQNQSKAALSCLDHTLLGVFFSHSTYASMNFSRSSRFCAICLRNSLRSTSGTLLKCFTYYF